MLRNLRIQSKLVLILFVPLCALAMFGAFGIKGRLDTLDAHQRFRELSPGDQALAQLSSALENESVVTTWYLASEGKEAKPEVAAARGETDRAVRQFHRVFGDFSGNVGEEARSQLTSLRSQLDFLRTERQDLDLRRVEAADPSRYYFDLDDQIFRVDALVARDLRDANVSSGLLEMLDLRRARQATQIQAAVVLAALQSGTVPSDALTRLSAAESAEHAALNDFNAVAPRRDLAAYQQIERERSRVLSELSSPRGQELLVAVPHASLAPAAWYSGTNEKADVYFRGSQAVGKAVSARADAQETTARRAVALFAGGVAIAMAVALLLAWIVSRAITRPLRALTKAARDVSRNQLPKLLESVERGAEPDLPDFDALPVSSRDEIGRLAEAFDNIQTVTYDVARKQVAQLRRGIGDLYVNLARRNHSLLGSQLELIDELERDEEDPDVLESLFRLDHLATRMRRNAESLLVLAGAEHLRRWREPLPLIDVVRAAAAEITDFSRVGVVGIEHDLSVAGNAVADLTHLLAELLENATSFSPPGTPVVIAGRWDDGRFVLSVTDEGLGMPEDRLADANALLAEPPAAGLTLSRLLGLHVVGHLAARHDVTVELKHAAPRGLTAVVTLPGSLLLRPGDTPARVASVGDELVTAAAPPGPPAGPPAEPPSTSDAPAPPNGSGRAPVVARAELPRRGSGTVPAPPVPAEPGGGAPPALTPRVPGRHLTYRPPAAAEALEDEPVVPQPVAPAPTGSLDSFRPEQVRNLLGQHRRGVERARADLENEQVGMDDVPPVPTPVAEDDR